MTRIEVFLLSPVCYIVLSIVVCWVLRKVRGKLKSYDRFGFFAGLRLWLTTGFFLGFLFSSLTGGYIMIWGPALCFGLWFVVSLLIGSLDEFGGDLL
jgi:hypothetical protein